jgi:hypothetical protein
MYQTYYTGNLPMATSIVTHHNPEHTYILPKSHTLCFPFQLNVNYYQIVIDMADTTPFERTFIPGSKAWPSAEAAGRSITDVPSTNAIVPLQPCGQTWNFWLAGMTTQPLIPTAINYPIQLSTTYWMNVVNLQNRESYFFCRFTSHGTGRTIVV